MNKRATGYVSWKRHRRSVHDPRVLAALNVDLQALAPDHTVVTGDLTNLALPIEFDQAIDWLAELGSPDDVSVIPGNHDAYIEQDLKTEEPSFPFVRKIGQTAIVGVSTAVPTRWFSAAGALGEGQLSRLQTMLHELGEAGMFRVVLIHHPPIDGSAVVRKQLRDGAEFRKVIAKAGAELVLHGHNHRYDQGDVKTPVGMVPVIGVPSASAWPKHGCKAAAYHLYLITPTPDGWQIQMDVRRFDHRSERFIAGEKKRFSIPSSVSAASAA
jgi:3',5'-cyclic AMP phosphodiesterase CpdA